MKDLCCIVFVFTREGARVDYRDYIPFYVYSFLKAYPEYDLKIYLNNEISPQLQRQIELCGNPKNLTIYENFQFDGLEIPKREPYEGALRALRWLVPPKDFAQYRACYVGDVDVFICKEEHSIYEQHCKHAEVLNLPYSNIIRSSPMPKNTSKPYIVSRLKRYGPVEALRYLRSDNSGWYQASGLHFYKTKEYYKAVGPQIPHMIESMNQLLRGKSKYWNRYQSVGTDEHVLYKLIRNSGLNTPPPVPSDKNININCASPSDIHFRPHHGLHFGIIRARPDWSDPQLAHPSYQHYFDYFEELYKNDETLRSLIANTHPIIKEQFANLMAYKRFKPETGIFKP